MNDRPGPAGHRRTSAVGDARGPGPSGRRGALAGAVSAGAALAVGEFLAAATDGAPSPLTAVGGVVVDLVPPAVEDAAIALFGTADKAVLVAGVVVVCLLVGAGIGAAAARRRWHGPAWYAVLAAVGAGASLTRASARPGPAVAAVAVAAAAGLGVLSWLLRAAGPGSSARPPGDADDPARRRFVTAVAGVAAAAVVTAAGARWLALARAPLAGADFALPAPARAVPPPGPEHAFAVPGLTPVVVPAGRFFRIDTALRIPRVDPGRWRLRITGMVERELEFTLDDLLAMPLVEDYVTIACVSNEVGGRLVGNARWTGVPLVDLLAGAGVRPGASQIVGRSVDGWTAGFPTAAAFDGREPLVALGMNGRPLPPRHGFPARLVVPGLYGYVSATKWLAEIELTTWDGFDAYWVPRGWAKAAPVKTQSRIDRPASRAEIDAGDVVVAGVAWAPLLGVEQVEVRVDDGPWRPAELTTALPDHAWVQWRATVRLPPGRHNVAVRATDGGGQTQTPLRSPPRPDGATGWHTIRLTAR